MADYRVYYDDGSTYDGPPEQAPERGVQCIVHKDPMQGRYILMGVQAADPERPAPSPGQFGYYCWHVDETGRGYWDIHDINGVWDYLASPGWKRVLFGRSIPNEQFLEIHSRADQDPDFPQSG